MKCHMTKILEGLKYCLQHGTSIKDNKRKNQWLWNPTFGYIWYHAIMLFAHLAGVKILCQLRSRELWDSFAWQEISSEISHLLNAWHLAHHGHPELPPSSLSHFQWQCRSPGICRDFLQSFQELFEWSLASLQISVNRKAWFSPFFPWFWKVQTLAWHLQVNARWQWRLTENPLLLSEDETPM